jgi:hypothetical protein
MFQHVIQSALTHVVRQIRELEQLVSGAAPGDKFTLLCMFLPF